ncbi:MAG: hypothetical protein ACR5LD_08130 [Symbiopectobacterium sp.]
MVLDYAAIALAMLALAPGVDALTPGGTPTGTTAGVFMRYRHYCHPVRYGEWLAANGGMIADSIRAN